MIGYRTLYHNKFGDTNGGNFSEFEDDGTYKANGDATVYNDIITPVANLRVGTTPPTFGIFRGNIYGLLFVGNQDDEVHGTAEFQHDYAEETQIEVHVHWSPITNNGGTIYFDFEYSIGNMQGTFTAPLTLGTAATVNANEQYAHRYTRLGYIDMTGYKIGTHIAYRLRRVASNQADTYADSICIHTLGIHYICDTLGSREMATK